MSTWNITRSLSGTSLVDKRSTSPKLYDFSLSCSSSRIYFGLSISYISKENTRCKRKNLLKRMVSKKDLYLGDSCTRMAETTSQGLLARYPEGEGFESGSHT